MAVSIEDKIELFRKMIFSDIENHSAEEKEKLLARIEAEKDRLRVDAEEKAALLFQEAEKKAEKESRELLAKVQAQLFHRLLEKKQALLEKMMALLREEAVAFVKSEGYGKHLADMLQKACRELAHAGAVCFYLTDADRSRYEQLLRSIIEQERPGGRYSLETAPVGILGGFRGEDGDKSMEVDYTLKTLIEDSREAIGTELSRRLDEVTL